jgi:hypothetical protein
MARKSTNLSTGGAVVSVKVNEPSAAGESGVVVSVVHVMGGVSVSLRWTAILVTVVGNSRCGDFC